MNDPMGVQNLKKYIRHVLVRRIAATKRKLVKQYLALEVEDFKGLNRITKQWMQLTGITNAIQAYNELDAMAMKPARKVKVRR